MCRSSRSPIRRRGQYGFHREGPRVVGDTSIYTSRSVVVVSLQILYDIGHVRGGFEDKSDLFRELIVMQHVDHALYTAIQAAQMQDSLSTLSLLPLRTKTRRRRHHKETSHSRPLF